MHRSPGDDGKAGRGSNPSDGAQSTMQTNDTKTQNHDAQPRHERLLLTARELLADADSEDDVLQHCQAVLDRPGYSRSRSQASLDASSVLLALGDSDCDTKRTREARQLLTVVSGEY